MSVFQLLFQRRANFSLSVISGLILSALLLLVSLTFLTTRWQAMVAQIDDQTASYEIRDNSRLLMRYLLDAQSNQRGYLLTSKTSYLGPYQIATTNVHEQMDRLKLLVAASPEQSRSMQEVASLADTTLTELAQTIALKRGAEPGRIPQVADSDQGQAQLDSIRTILKKFVDTETKNLSARRRTFEESTLTMTALIIGCFFAAVLTITFTLAMTFRQLKELGRVHLETEALNAQLEANVMERTAALEASLIETQSEKAAAEFERRRVEILMRELDHRVGNSLAMVSSLLGMQLSRTEDSMIRQSINAARMRVQTIGSSQRRLRLQDDFKTVAVADLFAAVIDDLVATFDGSKNITIQYDIAPLVFQARDATTCAILLGELVTNALKYGMDSVSGGTISVTCERLITGGILLKVEDNSAQVSSGERQASKANGLGTVILERLVQQYDGQTDRQRNKSGGTVVTVTLPKLDALPEASADSEALDQEDKL